jgi:hypothetical protein
VAADCLIEAANFFGLRIISGSLCCGNDFVEALYHRANHFSTIEAEIATATK